MSIEHYQPTTPAPIVERNGYDLIRSTALAMADANAIAKAVANTDMVPKHFRGKPDDLTAAILYGATLGFDPMQSARQIYVVHGQAALYARSMVALVMSAGHEVWTVATSDESVTVAGRRRDSDRVEESTWTIDRATKAGYVPTIDPATGKYRLNKWGKVEGNEKYFSDPQGMLYAKAASEVCRKIAPDVLNGVYSVEEMQSERVESERVDRPASSVGQLRAALGTSNPSPAPGAATPEPAVDATEPPFPPRDGVQQASAGEALLDPKSKLAKAMYAAILEHSIPKEDVPDLYAAVTGREVESSKELTEDEARAVLRALDDREKDTPLIDVTDAELVEDDQ